MLPIDELFDKRIGLGRAQYPTILCLFLMDMSDGAQLVLSSFLNPIIKQEWQLTSSQVQTVASVFYLGVLCGAVITGKLSDNHGRKPMILIGSFMQFAACCLFAFVRGYASFMLVRFLYGFTFGLTIALTTSMFSEIVPTSYRGKGLLLLNFFVSIGKVFSVILAYMYLDNFNQGNWKGMMVASSFLSLMVFAGGCFFMYESPRFQLARGLYQQSFLTLNHFIKNNNDGSCLTDEEKEGLVRWQQCTFQHVEVASISSIFQKQYLRTTLFLGGSWFMVSYMDGGQLTILPYVFGKTEQTFTSYVLTLLGEAPTILVSLALIDRQGFGRKRSLTMFFGGAAVMHFLFSLKQAALLSSVARTFMKLCFQMLYAFTTESYGTLNRTIGFGFCSAMGNVGATVMPFLVFPMLEVGTTVVFVSLAIAGVLGMVCSCLVPRDTLGTTLDTANEFEHIEQDKPTSN